MAAMYDDETQSIVVGTGNDRVAINLKQGLAVSGLTYIYINYYHRNTGSITITSAYVDFN